MPPNTAVKRMGQTLAFGCHTSVHAKARVGEHIPGSLGENFLLGI